MPVRGNERQKAIDRFETEEDSFMFLLSTRAGGVGINLTAAGAYLSSLDLNQRNPSASCLTYDFTLHHSLI